MVTVGGVRNPLPPAATVILATEEVVSVAVAVAPVPPPPVSVTVGVEL
jgi:hypothetical protein